MKVVRYSREVFGIQNPNINIEKVIRIGEKIHNKNRPLLVKLTNEEDRGKILRNARKLRFSEDYIHVYISRDMTEMEREKDKNLRLELKEKKERKKKTGL